MVSLKTHVRRISFGVAALLIGFLAAGCDLASSDPAAEKVTPDQVSEFTATHKVEFIALSAQWCHVCKKVPAVLEEIQPSYPKVQFLDLDIDSDRRGQKLAIDHNASSLPTMLLLIDGELAGTQDGLYPNDHIKRFIHKSIAKKIAHPAE